MTTLKQEGSQFIHRQEVSAHSVSPSVSIRRTCWFKNETSWDLHTVWSFSSLYFGKMQGLSQDFSEILWSWIIFFFPKQKMVLCFWSVSLIVPNHLCHLLLLYEYKVQRMYIITVFIWKARYVTSQFDPVNINGDICTSTLFTPQWQFPPSMWMLQKNCSEMARGHDKELKTSTWSPNSRSQSDRAFVRCLGQVRSGEDVMDVLLLKYPPFKLIFCWPDEGANLISCISNICKSEYQPTKRQHTLILCECRM